MRLALLASHPVQYYGPLYRALAAHVDLTVFFAHRPMPAEQAAAGFGVPFEWDVDIIRGYRHTFLGNVARMPGTHRFGGCDTPAIGDLLANGRFDALLVHGWHLKTYAQAIIAARRLGLPVLVRGDSHLATPRSTLKKAVKWASFPALLRLFAAVLYVGHLSRAYYRHYGYPPERLYFSPHCVDAEWFAARSTVAARHALRRRLGIADGVTLLLFAGKLLPFKRPLDLVAAAAICRREGRTVEVAVAGDGELRGPLLSAAHAAHVPLHHLGFRNQSEMPAAYAASDALVLPSDSRETWGMVANEALACGRPIILSDGCGSAVDLVGDAAAGISFRTGDRSALAAAIGALIDNPPPTARIAATSATYSLPAATAGIVDALAAVTRPCR